jgi:uncharacterized protein YndB with AHSA1/START domain
VSAAENSKEVRLEIWIEASPETVFALLTEPARMKTWLADLIVAEPRPGGRFQASGSLGAIEGTYLEVIPHTKVVFTWGGVEGVAPGQSTVEFTLEPERSGTRLRLRHYRLPRPAVEMHHRVWQHSGLVKIKDSAEGRMPAATCMSDAAAHGSSH